MACLPFWAYATPTQAVTKTKATVRPPYTSQPTIPHRFSSLPPAYPELFAVMGGQVPDLRGLFLRGTGGNAAELGTVQGDAIRNITGTFVTDFNSADYSRYMSGAFDATNVPGLIRLDGNVSHTDKLISFNVSRVVPTANENRPINRSVRYLVRARP